MGADNAVRMDRRVVGRSYIACICGAEVEVLRVGWKNDH